MSDAADRPASTTPKREAVQSAVLTATEELLTEGARFADLNIERIATRAGISRTAFYFYFKDKRELLVKLTEDVTVELYQQADMWFSGEGDPRDEVRDALRAVTDLYTAHGALMRVIVEVSTYEEEVAAFWRGLVDRFVVAAAERIRTEQRAGNAPGGDAGALAFALVWMCERTLYQQMVQEVPFDSADLASTLEAIFMRGIYARD
ncbi:HTH-type transcriptional regulator EthR [Paraconexibacter sp. AEG42_29]|uniref:HTH-type transcriptional regulator EthR n=1 Tax=Paraconexibacter sp. AEG42_29 TaxID=2997339 RepID=A0AAU7ASW9_9ACTN